MALKSFYQDIVIDTPEAAARLEAFLEEEPHLVVTDESTYTVNDPEFARRLHKRYCKKQG